MNKPKYTGERLEADVFNKSTVDHLHRYMIAQYYAQNKVVLDIASGEGYGTDILSRTAKYVYGVDISDASIYAAKKKYNKRNIKFKVGSTDNIPLENNLVDLVISFETIEHHDKHDTMMKEIRRVLKSDGVLIISSPDKKTYSDDRNYSNKFHVKELYKKDFVTLVNSYFDKLQVLNQSYVNGNSIVVSEGDLNNFELYVGDFMEVRSVKNNYMFIIIIASNYGFNNAKNSIFDGSQILLRSSNLSEVYNSYSFRLGYTLLWPFRITKRLVNKLKNGL